jgi:hypothetical protein
MLPHFLGGSNGWIVLQRFPRVANLDRAYRRDVCSLVNVSVKQEWLGGNRKSEFATE